MKHIVVQDQLDEVIVHPPAVFREFAEACKESARALADQSDRFVECDCPACGSANKAPAFDRGDYHYWECRDCWSVFVSPRPTPDQLSWYLDSSPVAELRRSGPYRDAMSEYRRDLTEYRADWAALLCSRASGDGECLVADIETRSSDYLHALAERGIRRVAVVNPQFSPGDLPAETAESVRIETDLSVLPAEGSLVTAFDVLEHTLDPTDLLRAAHGALRDGGLMALTGRSGSGFDIQVTWSDAKILPIEHLNLISVEGIGALLARAGFRVVELSTPGQLDVQLIGKTLDENPEAQIPRFVRYLFTHRDDRTRERLQRFLQENLLSSHLRVVGVKEVSDR